MNRLLYLLAILLALTACNIPPTPTDNFKIAVIVDTTTDAISQDQAEAVIAIANEKLIDLTGFVE